MQELRKKIVARLAADPLLTGPEGATPGGIWDRPLKQGNDPGATSSAWGPDPGDPARIIRLRPAIVVGAPNEVDPPDGPVRTGDPTGLRNAFLRLYIYVPANSTGKTALDTIDARIYADLDDWQTVVASYPATITVLEATEPVDSEEFAGTLVATRRLSAEYLRLV